jgi:hypothetical protein
MRSLVDSTATRRLSSDRLELASTRRLRTGSDRAGRDSCFTFISRGEPHVSPKTSYAN